MEKLKQTIAVLFRRKGKARMSEKEFVFSASIDMRWFSPKSAQRLLDLALQSGLLTKRDGELTPNFGLDEMDVPMDFRPTEDMLSVGVEDLLSRMLARLSSSGLDRREAAARIAAVQEMYGIAPEVAALFVANDLGLDMREFHPQVEGELAKRARG